MFLRITMCSSNHGISLYHPRMTRRVTDIRFR
ncbi:CTP synthetase [Bifidobacterium breve]|uniref:CTP synthetase n=1 Tax=Bifidobacterium breve TaxID=1685 RepID=A0AAP9G4J4_BIFBR|nr:CTP synthetase [Bifidobacterium breve]AYZ88827.1 CTP synthetase [Bifidobacterium breve]AZI16600.1 CTP synthetase [Bifidobacterium breve]KAB1932695.1 CTP synthetase [Bifidobacterium breve]MBD3901075.1 CTP synthetase [Bifidobacterium breve]